MGFRGSRVQIPPSRLLTWWRCYFRRGGCYSRHAGGGRTTQAPRGAAAQTSEESQEGLGFLELNPKHPGLQTHEFSSLTAILGVKVFEAYVENQTPGAFRIFWYYGRDQAQITIYSITPHP